MQHETFLTFLFWYNDENYVRYFTVSQSKLCAGIDQDNGKAEILEKSFSNSRSRWNPIIEVFTCCCRKSTDTHSQTGRQTDK
jgi:hypothetical protein